MAKHIFVLMLSGVSVLGLVSCTPKPAVEYDSWALAPIEVHGPRSQDTQILRATGNPPITIDSALSIQSKAASGSADSDPLALTVISSCHDGLSSDTLTIETSKTHVIPINALVPASFINRLEPLKENTLHCSWDIKAKNTLGSTHVFDAKEIQITHLERLEKLALWMGEAETMDALSTTQGALDFSASASLRVSANDLSPQGESTAKLVCDSFFNQRKFDGKRSLSEVAKELFSGKIESGTDTPSAPRIDPRLTKNAQECRLIVRTEDPSTGLSRVTVSPKVKTLFPLPKPEISAGMTLGRFEPSLSLNATNFANHSVFRILIRNQYPFALGFSYPIGEGHEIELRPVYMTRDGVAAQSNSSFREKLHFEFTGIVGQRRVGNDNIFEIAPGEAVTIEAKLKSPMEAVIVVDNADKLLAKGNAAFIGFIYRYNSPIQLRQFRNWNAPEREWSLEDISPLASPAGDSSAAGWIPHLGWIAYSGTGDLPKPLHTFTFQEQWDNSAFMFYPPGQFARIGSGQSYIAY